MKKLTLYALKHDRDNILLNLQRDGNVMLLQAAESASLAGAEELGARVETTKGAISFVGKHGGKASLLAGKKPVGYELFLNENHEGAEL